MFARDHPWREGRPREGKPSRPLNHTCFSATKPCKGAVGWSGRQVFAAIRPGSNVAVNAAGNSVENCPLGRGILIGSLLNSLRRAVKYS